MTWASALRIYAVVDLPTGLDSPFPIELPPSMVQTKSRVVLGRGVERTGPNGNGRAVAALAGARWRVVKGIHPFRSNAAIGGWRRSSLNDLPSDGGYIMSVPISTMPRIEPIWLHGGGSFIAYHALGVGENGIGDGLVGFRLLQERFRLLEVGLRLLQERLPNCPFIKAPIDLRLLRCTLQRRHRR